jgi:hypothetical protein
MTMPARVLAALLAVTAPFGALADRGALSLEAGGVVAGVRAEPAVGAGDAITGAVAGVTLGTRYAVSNHLEASGTIDWFASAPFYNDSTVIATPNGSFRGQLQSRIRRYSAKVGAQYVQGLVWRLRLGAEIGWTRLISERLDLVDVAPTVPRSFGLELGSRSTDHFVLVGLAGVEWMVTDHVSFAVTPRLEFPFGGGLMAVTVPFTVAYSWYAL